MDLLEKMITPITLADLPKAGDDILKGQVQGRLVVDMKA
jgi:acrylyl-CoA reductase (NADPH)